jgi:hypothetical protein
VDWKSLYFLLNSSKCIISSKEDNIKNLHGSFIEECIVVDYFLQMFQFVIFSNCHL